MRKLIRSIGLGVVLSCGALVSSAQSPGNGLPAVPTTKVLAIGRITEGVTTDARRPVMPSEVRETVKLYLAGKIDQWYVRGDGKGVVFLMNVSTVDEAHTLLEKLPLGVAKMMEFDLIPLGPLSPLTVLLNQQAGSPSVPAPAK
jgi:hypothetical protein